MNPKPKSALTSGSTKGHADDVYVLLQWASGKPHMCLSFETLEQIENDRNL